MSSGVWCASCDSWRLLRARTPSCDDAVKALHELAEQSPEGITRVVYCDLSFYGPVYEEGLSFSRGSPRVMPRGVVRELTVQNDYTFEMLGDGALPGDRTCDADDVRGQFVGLPVAHGDPLRPEPSV